MNADVIVVLLALSIVIPAFGTLNRSSLRNAFGNNELRDGENLAAKKVKRWASGFQDIALDYPDFDDSFGDNQLEIARPFSTSPGNVVFYRPGSRRPSGAVTRTVFNPPSGFIPRVIAAAKAAIATLTGPQTVLSKTTYLAPPRPGITALQVPQVPQVPGSDGGTSATNAAAAAAAAAAAVAAVTRTIYEAAGLRGSGYYEKGTYLPSTNYNLPPTNYNSYGIWPEPARSPWTILQPPDLTVRIPYEWGDRPGPQIKDAYGPPAPTWFNQNLNPIMPTDTRNPWMDNTHKVSFNDYNNQWGYKNQGGWVQENRLKDWMDEKRVKSSYGRAGGNQGYAAATADTPPNGDSFADAKITANGASAVAAAVWDLGGIRGRVTESKRMKTEVYGVADDYGREENTLGTSRKEKFEDDRFSGRVDSELNDRTTDHPKCGDRGGCLPKTNSERLRNLFTSRRKS